ncbi:MAG: DUF5666 domain-containing protein [Bryobacteraceae bacterium]
MAPALLAFSVLCPAQPDDVQDLGPKIFQAQWVSVARLPNDASSLIPFPWGDDTLTDGEIEVRAKGQVKVDLEGAVPEVSYALLVCRLSSVSDRCSPLGTVPTDSRGRANAVVPWPEGATGPHSVFFVLRRSEKTMFVTGFHMPSGVPPVTGNPPNTGKPPEPPKPEWKEVEIKGTIDSVGSGSFVVGGQTVLVDAETRYVGRVKEFSDLKPGMKVEVSGTSVAGGVLAARVLVTGKI